MKKIFVSLGVVGAFILYSLGVRHELPAVAAPATTVASNTAKTSTISNNPTKTPVPTGQYKDGSYTGSVTDAYYGNVQVQAKISGGKITDVSFLAYPNDHSDSVMINQQAIPYLKQEAIQAQSAKVQVVSGATFTSEAFVQSLTAALSQAKA